MTIIDTSYNKLVTIEHICIACRRTFDQVKAAIEASIPELDPNVVQALTSGDQAVVTAFEQHGPRLFRFLARDHGALLQIVGENRHAIQYEIGNPITASRMTRHNLAAALYAPLRVVLFETDAGEVFFEYDRPSSLFGQFDDARIQQVGLYLDNELRAALIQAAA